MIISSLYCTLEVVVFLLDIVNRKFLAPRSLPQVHLWRHKDIELKTFHKNSLFR